MSINIKSLGLSSQKQIRETVNTPQGNIEVYEPTLEVIGQIIDLQNELGLDMEKEFVTFTGVEVIKNLFPLVTNVSLDLTDEELEEVINNPSIHLMVTQQYVAQIVSEANKLYAERLKTELMNTDSAIAQLDLIQSIPQMIVERAKVDGKINELTDAVIKAGDDLDEAIAKQEAEAGEVVEDVTETIDIDSEKPAKLELVRDKE